MMVTVRTNLMNTRESARQIRVEPTIAIGGNITQTNVQKALEQIAAFANITPAATQIIVAGGSTIIAATTQLVIINKSVASVTPLQLPSVLLRPDNLGLEIYDYSGLGGDITLTPFGTETIMGANSPWIIGSGGVPQTGGSVRMMSSLEMVGWVLR